MFAPATQPVLFSAVKINITTPPSWVAPNNFLRLYYFNIDDGDQLYDNYLTNSSSKSHVFFTSYEGIGRSENFTANVDFVFKEQTHSFTDFPNVNSHTIDEIKITQNISGGNVNVIRYNNLNF